MNKNTCFIYSPIDTFSGYGARSRDIVKAILQLKKEVWDIKVIPCNWGNTPLGFIDENPEWSFLNEHLSNGQLTSQPDIFIWITIPSEYKQIGKYNIGINAGIETTAVAADWIEGSNRVELNLVSSNHSKKVYLDTNYQKQNPQTKQIEGVLKLEKQMEVLFEGVDLNTYKPLESVSIPEIDKIPEDFAYLFVSHWIGPVFEDRKNVGLLIKAFYETFKNKKNKPALILKTCMVGSSYMDRDEILKRIQSIKSTVNSNDLPNIYLLHGDFTNEKMNQIYNHPKIKVMVNLTKGEGFGRTFIEFSQTKKPLITTKWSGQMDFLKPEFTPLINGTLTDIHPSSVNQWIIKESKWFSPDAGEIGFYLKDVFENYKNYIDGAKRQAYYCKTNFSYDKMVEKLDEYLKLVPEFPKQMELKLPVLKKIELPKLKKLEPTI